MIGRTTRDTWEWDSGATRKMGQKKGGQTATLNNHPGANALETAIEQEINVIQFGTGIARLTKHLRHGPMIVIDMGVT